MHNKDATACPSAETHTLSLNMNRIRDLFDVGYEVENTAIHLLTSYLLLDVLE